ncbi:MAG: radical SAM protein, partial [Candidatus Portnoybacteria bacterium]
GGEPTLHPRFLDIFWFVRKNFPKHELRLLTNGRRFYYRDFAEEIMSADNLNIAVSLCGPNKKIHDGITQTKNSFTQMVKGLENILDLKKDQTIEIRTVLSNLSARYIDQTLNFINSKFPSIDRVIVIYLETEGQAEKNLNRVMISYSEIRPYLDKIYPFFSSLKELRLYHFPLCALDYKFWPHVWRTLPEKEVAFISSCKQCRYKKYCLGIHRDYPDKTRNNEFKPIKEEYIIEESGDFYHPIIGISKNDI